MYCLEELTTKFNTNIKQLVGIIGDVINSETGSAIGNKKEAVALFETAKRKINLVINTDPVFMIDSAGSYLYKYRDAISSDDFTDFIMNTEKYICSEDKEQIEFRISASDENDVNYAEVLLKSLRLKWLEFSDVEKKVITKIIKRLLSEHCKYLLYNIKKDN
jgi:hypothetical protein